jgi:RNA recognition motif-containing protein
MHDGDRKRSEQDNFIIEDTLCVRFTSFVDRVIFLDLSEIFLKYRVIKRYIRQKLGLENANYQPSLQMLRQMFIWQKIDRRDLIEVQPHLIVLRSKSQIKKFIEGFKNDKNDCRPG